MKKKDMPKLKPSKMSGMSGNSAAEQYLFMIVTFVIGLLTVEYVVR